MTPACIIPHSVGTSPAILTWHTQTFIDLCIAESSRISNTTHTRILSLAVYTATIVTVYSGTIVYVDLAVSTLETCNTTKQSMLLTPLTPGRFKANFRRVIFKLILVTNGWGIYCEIALRWMSMNPTDDKSTLVQVMAWCCQATSHYLSQCWPRSLSPYSVTRPRNQMAQSICWYFQWIFM